MDTPTKPSRQSKPARSAKPATSRKPASPARATPTNPIADLRPTLAYFALAATTIVFGILLRFTNFGLPVIVVKYGGSALWAMMIYFLVAALMPHRNTIAPAIISAAIANLVELSRLYHTSSLDAFRLTLAGALLLGRVFEPLHLLTYTAAILLTALIDQVAVRRVFHG